MKSLVSIIIFAFILPYQSFAESYLVKYDTTSKSNFFQSTLNDQGFKVKKFEYLPWVLIERTSTTKSISNGNMLSFLQSLPGVSYVQPDYPVKLLNDFKVTDPILREMITERMANSPFPVPTSGKTQDNPAIPPYSEDRGSGADPNFDQQWGMKDIEVKKAWQKTRGSKDIVVAVLDTGVDYTHEDLQPNMWRNPGETGKDENGKDKATNGKDDDGNGFIDDVVGWDFVSDDNKPFDLTLSMFEIILGGGNPGHGTHCAGNVGARGDNGKGIAGVAPNVKIMALRFLSEKGQGKTSGALKSLEYAIKNGAQILSNSWGSEGEDSKEDKDNQALKEMIRFAEEKGVLFVAAAGNGRGGNGYSNDNDSKPAYPASYDMDIIISVAALDSEGKLGKFSNWGNSTVDIGAPGVKVFSTVPGGKYSDTVVDLFGMKVTWDGTSMAAPHVSGAAALYWSLYPEKSWREVKSAILDSAVKIPSMSQKSVSEGKLNVNSLLQL